MPTKGSAGNSTVGTDGRIDEQLADFVDTAVAAFEETEAAEETVDALETAGDALVDTLEEATIIVEDDDIGGDAESAGGEDDQEAVSPEDDGSDEDAVDVEEVQDLLFKQIENQKDRREVVNRRLSTLEEEVFEDNPHTSDGKHHAAPRVTPQTPLEDLARLSEHNIRNESKNVRRALFVARNVSDYATSVPGGWQIPWSDLRRVLKAGMDSGHPQTVKRVMEVLETFGDDTVRIVDREKYEKRIVFEDEAVKRLHILCQDDENENHGNVSAKTG